MSGDVHVRFCESRGVRLPPATHLRIFVSSRRKAHEALAFLANILFKNHGLSLQEAKTEIVPTEKFIERFGRDEEDEAADSVRQNFEQLLAEVGLDTYELPDLDDLPDEVIAQIEKANLWQLLQDQLDSERPDQRLVRFALRQIGNAGLRDHQGFILSAIEQLIPSFPHALRAATASPTLTASEMVQIGSRLLDLVEDSDFGHLEYFRAWVLDVFRDSAAWNHAGRLQAFHKEFADSLTRCGATLALGVSGSADHWFRSHRDELGVKEPWERRAFLAGAACLPKDERKFWFNSMKPGLDRLERAVVDWALAAPQGTRQAVPDPPPASGEPGSWDPSDIPF